MSGAINWIGTWYKPAGPLTGQEIASHFTYLLTEGLRARPANSTKRTATPTKATKKTR